jgi:hypothetical protein
MDPYAFTVAYLVSYSLSARLWTPSENSCSAQLRSATQLFVTIHDLIPNDEKPQRDPSLPTNPPQNNKPHL